MEINFNPTPQSNWADALSTGATSGLSLGLGVRKHQMEQQKFQADQLAAKAKDAQDKKDQAYVERERRQKDFDFGRNLLKDSAFLNGFDPESINKVINNQIKPYLVQDLGIPIETDLDYSQIESITKRFNNIMDSKTPIEMKKEGIAKLVMLATPEEQKQLESASKMAFGGEMNEYQQSMIDLRRDEMAARAAKANKITAEAPKAKASLTNTLRGLDNMIAEAKAIKDDPGLEMATGVSSFMGNAPGALSLGAKRPRARLETLKAKTLLEVLANLKELSATGSSGFGQLSNIEGENLRNSITTLDPGLQTPDFKDSLDRFIAEIEAKKGVLQTAFDETYGGVAVGGSKSNQNATTPPPEGGWNEAKESRYQELLRKRNKK